MVIKPVTLTAPVPGAAGGSRPPRKWGWTGCYLKTVRRRSRDRLGPWQPTAAEAGLRSLEQPLRARLRGAGTIRQNGKVESCGAVQLLLNTLKAKKKGRELGRTLWLTAFSKNRGAANYSG